jgi:hypothetical protein
LQLEQLGSMVIITLVSGLINQLINRGPHLASFF